MKKEEKMYRLVLKLERPHVIQLEARGVDVQLKCCFNERLANQFDGASGLGVVDEHLPLPSFFPTSDQMAGLEFWVYVDQISGCDSDVDGS